MVRHALALGVVLLLGTFVPCARAAADGAVVVLDRGRAAKADARRHERVALRLVELLEARGIPTRLVLYGARPDGRIRASRLTGDLEDRVARAAAKEGWRFEAPTDPRHALAVAVDDPEGAAAVLVLLVGPFGSPVEEGEDAGDGGGAAARGDAAGDVARARTQAAEALTAWEKAAAPGARAFALDLDPGGRALLAGVRGVVSAGAVVLASGEAVAEAAPWSPLAVGAQAVLRAEVRVPLEVLTVGGGPRDGVLRAVSSDGHGVVTAAASEARGSVAFAVTRPQPEGGDAARVETVAFEASTDPSVLWLTDPPQPRTLQWTTLRADARISWFARPAGVPPVPVDATRPLDAEGLLVGRPLVRLCRVEHTRVGEPPVWRVTASEGELPDELTVTAGEVVNLDEEVAYRELELRFEARPGTPGSSAGTLVVRAAGHPRRFEVPYRVVVPPGRVVVRLETPGGSLRLPPADDAAPWALVVEEESPNAPPLVRVEAVLAPPSLASALTARLAGGGSVDLTWDLTSPLALRPGRRYDLHLDLAPGVRDAAGTLALRLPEQRGVTGAAVGLGHVEARSPRLVVASQAWAYTMRGGEVAGDPPLVLIVDADGGGGDWRLALQQVVPVVSTPPGAPVAFGLRSEGPGRWAVVPEGPWRGARGDTFSARQEAVAVGVGWSPGVAPEDLVLPIEVRPRWGRVGFILVGLTVLALALGLWSLLQMKAAPVDGTLLYQVEGREGAVGRLDLAPAGRRKIEVHADAVGRLSFTARPDPASAPVVVIRPTRVGAVLEIPASPPERHLLVDGLTVKAARHRIRYVSDRPGDATVPAVTLPEEELLGPEFDMPSGRIDALGRPDRTDPEGDGEAAQG